MPTTTRQAKAASLRVCLQRTLRITYRLSFWHKVVKRLWQCTLLNKELLCCKKVYSRQLTLYILHTMRGALEVRAFLGDYGGGGEPMCKVCLWRSFTFCAHTKKGTALSRRFPCQKYFVLKTMPICYTARRPTNGPPAGPNPPAPLSLQAEVLAANVGADANANAAADTNANADVNAPAGVALNAGPAVDAVAAADVIDHIEADVNGHVEADVNGHVDVGIDVDGNAGPDGDEDGEDDDVAEPLSPVFCMKPDFVDVTHYDDIQGVLQLPPQEHEGL
ncbi:hypothetical protein BCR41DRAFT_374688 [Lobosporangium transversale]|uniref:Uncharacterized protein n=1 Tax=Lobosporangium transversale TaxID=64571 RepID=A0A1Y2G9S6_9FUNG|nr:hypothetical protein BCR41DRAFT_374688 [Lobosporangium transversale]ORZ05014.1 hypothetical protein BCR41DRAFT_374688 [Lobosporangium transversale]|eukprot:XP_021876878.1 hypothetical protein BCR41DRAFT_374688 [Lobosporangium transversale]